MKGLLFLFLEFLINVNSNLNEVIVFSFTGEVSQAIAKTNYEWICCRYDRQAKA
jgi:hypothetical protein